MSKFFEKKTGFSGLYKIEKLPVDDPRGSFERLYCPLELSSWNSRPIAQINRSLSPKKGTIRGLHFQNLPFCDAKLIFCLRGKVFDVALDLRYGSNTFGKYFSMELDASENNAVLIPEGFAHGFQTMTANVEILYIHSAPYKANHESGINVFDSNLEINWPENCNEISNRDLNFDELSKCKGIHI